MAKVVAVFGFLTELWMLPELETNNTTAAVCFPSASAPAVPLFLQHGALLI